jgi:hypothetical protein
MIASEDVESQRKGVVLVVWPGGPGNDWKGLDTSDRRSRHLLSQRHEVLPIRFAGYHYCMPDNPIFRLIRSFAILYGGLGGEMKARMRFHIGTCVLLSLLLFSFRVYSSFEHSRIFIDRTSCSSSTFARCIIFYFVVLVGVDTELRYTLQGYGIPIDYIPVTGTGNIKLNYLKQWINVRKIVESTQGRLASETIVECPGSNDVIFKPGKRLSFHPGNTLFQELILSKSEEYTTTIAKQGLYRWLMYEIQVKRNGRFLKWNDDEYWTELKVNSQITTKISTFCKKILSRSKKSSRANKNKTMLKSSTDTFQNHQIGDSNKRQRCDGYNIFPCSERT